MKILWSISTKRTEIKTKRMRKCLLTLKVKFQLLSMMNCILIRLSGARIPSLWSQYHHHHKLKATFIWHRIGALPLVKVQKNRRQNEGWRPELNHSNSFLERLKTRHLHRTKTKRERMKKERMKKRRMRRLRAYHSQQSNNNRQRPRECKAWLKFQ